MNDSCCTIFINLINIILRMMPIFICLEPKKQSRENIAAISVYIWVIMLCIDSLFTFDRETLLFIQMLFSTIFFLVLLVFFKGKTTLKAFLYISAWLFEVISVSFNEFFAWVLRKNSVLTYKQICLIVSLISACIFFVFVYKWLRKNVLTIFNQLVARYESLLIVYPLLALIIMFIGINTIFSPSSLSKQGGGEISFFLALCIMIMITYVLILSNTRAIVEGKKAEEELQYAKHMISKQRDHYNQVLDYIEQVRIIRHDFRHHIYALQSMDKDEQNVYLKSLQKNLDQSDEIFFCQNQSLNGLLQDYNARAKKNNIDFDVRLDISHNTPVDDLTLCIIIGNLLENAFEACSHIENEKFISIHGRWADNSLMMIVENSYDGHVNKKNGNLVSRKKDGGLGLISIKRMLSKPGNEFEVSYDDNVFTVMIKIVPSCEPC